MERLRKAGGVRPWALAALLIAGAGATGCGGGGESTQGEGASDVETFEVPASDVGTYLHLVLPSVIRKNDDTAVRLRVVTQAGLPDYDFEGSFRLRASSPDVEFPRVPQMTPTQEGVFRMAGLKFRATGVQRVEGTVPEDTVRAFSNPFVVVDEPEWHVYWGDLNGQSDLSTGTRQPYLYFWYAKSVALLDFVALTDLDHVDSPPKQLTDDAFRSSYARVGELESPNAFVVLPAFEWTSAAYGNRLVYFSEMPKTLPPPASGIDTPQKLQRALPAGALVAIPHPAGSAEAPPVDPGGLAGEPLVEIYSSRGSFEQPGSPRPSTRETPGAFVRDLLERGLRPGFLGDSDTELTAPGNPLGFATRREPWPGGLTAVLAKDLSRGSLLDALRARRCYATSGSRYLLEFTVDGEPMGSEIPVAKGHRADVYGSLGSTTNWVRVDILGPEGPIASLNPDPTQADVVELRATTEPWTKTTYCYLRGVDEFGGMAWSSPVFLVPE
jgi:hypothetical protein